MGKGKERMTRSEAQTIAQKATQVVFDGFEELGHPFKAGQIDGEGNPITEERAERIRRIIDEAGIKLLREAYTIY